MRLFLGRLALPEELPQRTRPAQIAWTFNRRSANAARPGINSSAPSGPLAGTPIHAYGLGPIRSRARRNIRLQVLVRDNNVDQALKALKKKMQREGIFREMKLRGHYEKPSEKKARERAEAIRRARKLARKKLQREGLLPGQAEARDGRSGWCASGWSGRRTAGRFRWRWWRRRWRRFQPRAALNQHFIRHYGGAEIFRAVFFFGHLCRIRPRPPGRATNHFTPPQHPSRRSNIRLLGETVR